MTLPLGLFSAATLSAPLPAISETTASFFPLHPELLHIPTVDPDGDGLSDDLYWDDGSV
jgi:hypothetical protein